MRRFTYRCNDCGSAFDEFVGGTDAPPQKMECHDCGGAAPREWVAPQACFPDKEIEWGKDATPVMQGHDPLGRSARQIERESEKIQKSKRIHARRTKRARGSSRKGGMRHIGSIDAREMLAYNKRAGGKQAFFEDPKKALKRTGNLFGND